MKRILTLLFISIPILTFAQSSNIGNWLIYIGSKKINSQFNWHHEVQYRNYNAIGDLEQLLLRTGVGYDTGNNTNLLLGYGYILSENYIPGSDEKSSIGEHRIFQQFISKQTLNRLQLQHRYRFEQRFVSSDFRLRFRYFLALTYPLNNPTITSQTFYLSAYNELFINTSGAAFDRNRLYGGLGYCISPSIKLELGYMNQFFESSGRDQINIIALASF
jgi:hypothetical protein